MSDSAFLRRARRPPPQDGEVLAVVLAGGLSTRMGQDKAQVRWGRQTLLELAMERAGALGWPVTVIRQDRLRRRGPLGGIDTAFRKSEKETLVFLAVDMPFVSDRWLKKVARESRRNGRGAFASIDGVAGFPFALQRKAFPVVTAQMTKREYSLQSLARELRATLVEAGAPAARRELENLNTPEDLAAAQNRRQRRLAK